MAAGRDPKTHVVSASSRYSLQAAAATLLASALLTAGCESPAPRTETRYASPLRAARETQPIDNTFDATVVPTRDDIVAVHTFWHPVPWLFDSSNRAVGFRVPVVFVSGKTEKGAFVSGEISCRLYERGRDAAGYEQRRLVHEWRFDPQAAMHYRYRRRSVPGYQYGFMLNWPRETVVDGREIEIEFAYQRSDGREITSVGRRFRVPVPNEYRPPAPAATREAPASGPTGPGQHRPPPGQAQR
jgi:hypothetical protein